ncbi:Glucose 1-dehydrogenase [uncultured Eubacteriales bacterium]|uniref:Glucose 1-dehydrogenase n=1 Tax=uncultured Eubacteriales bacterium TaxID=172733 RepID=A0A212K821_9FIRM|nr:Glucose 1-dehydrogenase [uncultured Eubacteriales bacterium]
MDLGLKDKTVIVTGGAKGIGSGISEIYAQEGANLVINYHSDQAGAEAFKAALAEKYGVRIVCVQGDVGSEKEAKHIFDAAEGAFGTVDILVNNAGRGHTADFREITLEDWNRCLNDNLTGQFLMSREFARRAIPAKRKGWIVNILSKASVSSTTKGRVCYVANKAGELGLTHAMAVDLTGHGIRVNGVMPGFVMASTMRRQLERNPEDFARRVGRVPIGRPGEPWEIGTMVAFLSSEKCELAVGACVDMTGGLLLGF